MLLPTLLPVFAVKPAMPYRPSQKNYKLNIGINAEMPEIKIIQMNYISVKYHTKLIKSQVF
ncbi:hypothetical protein DXA96_10070 [Lachnospiraceae bacterium OF09-33XD]|nr:hypothetical protein DXA96_10070 [Lachnospiraceae bacterium OF09-33XD]